MPRYRVLIAKEVIASLGNGSRHEKLLITRLFDDLADDPYRVVTTLSGMMFEGQSKFWWSAGLSSGSGPTTLSKKSKSWI
jgi:hypothetical protein